MRLSSLRAVVPVIALLLALPAAAAPTHGKVGLWTITSTMRIGNMPLLAPDVVALMRRKGQAPANGYLAQMCMTQTDVATDTPPHVTDRSIDCRTRVLKTAPAAVSTETICYGPVEGVSHTLFTWTGNTHFSADYQFKGKVRGTPRQFSTTYTGDWISPDCGGVRPFVSQLP